MTGQVFRVIGFSVLLSFSAIAAGGETGEVTKSWDDFKIITDRNIFSRNRTKSVQLSEVRRQSVAVLPEQAYYILRGIIRQSDGFISFIEDSRTMDVKRFRTGETIGEGKISKITLDYISYEFGDNTINVEIGMNLEGQVSSSGTQYYSSGFGDFQGISGFRETDQFPATDQSQVMGEFPAMDQSRTPTKNQASIQPVTETSQQDENRDNILQRLKERRKKELEE